MSEFVLVKNSDNSGHLMLRIASIRGADDDFTDDGKPDGCTIWYENEEDCYSASTAAEVLEAIQAAQDVAPIARTLQGGAYIQTGRNSISPIAGEIGLDKARGQDTSRFTFYRNADTSQANGEIVTRNTILAGPIGEQWHHVSPLRASPVDGSQLSSGAFAEERIAETRAQVGSCICPHHQGDNPACPVHGEGTAWGDLHGG